MGTDKRKKSNAHELIDQTEGGCTERQNPAYVMKSKQKPLNP